MSSSVTDRLDALGIILPVPSRPAANYRPFVLHRGLLSIAGQLPLIDNSPVVTGRVPDQVALDAARDAARLCAINILAQCSAALGGDLDRIAATLRVCGYVQAAHPFDGHAQVVNGASDLICDVLGEAGRHARAAVGCASLPRNAPVEVEALFAVT
ncbi:MAG: RidA family protein [Pseudomonadota bacterium]